MGTQPQPQTWRTVRRVVEADARDGRACLVLDTGEAGRLTLDLALPALREVMHALLLAAVERWPELAPAPAPLAPEPVLYFGASVRLKAVDDPQEPLLVLDLKSACAGPLRVVLELRQSAALLAGLQPIVEASDPAAAWPPYA